MKKLLILISVIFLCGSIELFSQDCGVDGSGKSPVSYSAGIEALRAQFEDGLGPETSGYDIDYKYYSPVGTNDTCKYPMIVWLHGMGQGLGGEGAQIRGNDIPMWSSLEYQRRVQNKKGMFVFVPRSPENEGTYWTTMPTESLQASITDFISHHGENIDVKRIYMGGFSLGGMYTWRMLIAYPGYYAAALPVCPAYRPTEAELVTFNELPTWLTSSTLGMLWPTVGPTWTNMKNVMNHSKIRMSTMGAVLNPDGSVAESNHHSWVPVTYDGFTNANEPYYNTEITDGDDDIVKLTYPYGYIDWLTQWKNDRKMLTTSVEGNGKISLSPNAGSFEEGAGVTITAVPKYGSSFTGWSGDLSGTANPVTITMNNSISITAIFEGGNAPVNLALDKPTHTSSLESEAYNDSLAVDGNAATRWSSSFSDPQYIYVDLGEPKKVTEIKLIWEVAYASAYSIQYSDDAANWIEIFSTSSGDGGTDEIILDEGINTQYVRMHGTVRSTPYGYSLYEFEVKGYN